MFAFSPSVNVLVVELGNAPSELDAFYRQSKEALERSMSNVNFIEDKKINFPVQMHTASYIRRARKRPTLSFYRFLLSKRAGHMWLHIRPYRASMIHT